MKKSLSAIKKVGEKVANSTILPLCFPFIAHQPTPPASIRKAMQEQGKK